MKRIKQIDWELIAPLVFVIAGLALITVSALSRMGTVR